MREQIGVAIRVFVCSGGHGRSRVLSGHGVPFQRGARASCMLDVSSTKRGHHCVTARFRGGTGGRSTQAIAAA